MQRPLRPTRTNTLFPYPTRVRSVARDGTHKPDYQPGLELHAKYTFLAEGVRGHLSKELIRQFDLARDSQPQGYGLGIQELWGIDPENKFPAAVYTTPAGPLASDATGEVLPIIQRDDRRGGGR